MNVKRVFGILLTLAGLIGLIYGAMDLTSGGVARASIVYLVLGGIFFFSGIGLIRGTKDVAE
ncbi:hypothetical protein [Larkinella soli]|uniref:hypothetical protein n=1 Tax=Larkinella soli TaxID=1770527 RepID=UPI000FFBBBBC|nr:hypothetical protein [Larkinella soli]